MGKKFICKYCRKDLTDEPNKRGAHVGNCKKNPKRIFDISLLSERVKKIHLKKKIILKREYYKNPRRCLECNKLILFENKHKKFCCHSHATSFTNKIRIRTKISKEEQANKLRNNENFKNSIKKISNERRGKRKDRICEFCGLKIDLNNKENSKRFHRECRWKKRSYGPRKGSSRGKCGWYKGYWCDSSWELAFVIYNLEHGIKFKRNEKFFEYEFENKMRKFYPDFILEDGTIIEIKSYMNERNHLKINAVKGIVLLMKNNGIEKYLDYTINKYGKGFVELYDRKF